MLLIGGGGEWIERGKRGSDSVGEVCEDVQGGREKPIGAVSSSRASGVAGGGDS